eukprot:3730843-Pyramimonas_sp.AAC.2
MPPKRSWRGPRVLQEGRSAAPKRSNRASEPPDKIILKACGMILSGALARGSSGALMVPSKNSLEASEAVLDGPKRAPTRAQSATPNRPERATETSPERLIPKSLGMILSGGWLGAPCRLSWGPPKTLSRPPKRSWEYMWGPFGPFWGSWAVFGPAQSRRPSSPEPVPPLLACLGASWGPRGALLALPGGPLGPSWGHFLGRLGALLDRCWPLWRASGAVLELSLGPPGSRAVLSPPGGPLRLFWVPLFKAPVGPSWGDLWAPLGRVGPFWD